MGYRMVYQKGTTEDIDTKFVMRTSSDGVSWSAEATIVDETVTPGNNVKGPSFTKLSDGRLLLVYNRTTPDPVTRLGIFVRFSSDDGATWGDAIQIDIAGYTDEAEGGPVVELGDGTLVCPWWGSAGGAIDCGVIFSADDGATWGSQVLVGDGSADSRHYYEPNVLLLANGSLLMSIREAANTEIWFSTSADSGATWSAAASGFAGQSAARMTQLSTGKIIALYRQSTGGGVTCYRTSDDDGATWSDEQIILVDNHTCTYGGSVELSGSRVGIVYGVQWALTEAAIHYKIMDFSELP